MRTSEPMTSWAKPICRQPYAAWLLWQRWAAARAQGARGPPQRTWIACRLCRPLRTLPISSTRWNSEVCSAEHLFVVEDVAQAWLSRVLDSLLRDHLDGLLLSAVYTLTGLQLLP